ncbi:hypothetical protein [Bacillus sinesaloumensis]|uniref:hypothetical protein n=1 Tax=Litchfieldia sinesaloumensis TaxID=1926280 RepID=UPI0009885421|nr:hypothetical protein [Bacillus sinesaloumensis]
MKKRKLLIVATLLILVAGMTACSKSSDETVSPKEELKSDKITENTNDDTTADSTASPQNSELNRSKSAKEDEGKPSQNTSKPDNTTSTKNQSKPDNTSDSTQSNGSSNDSKSKTDSSEGKQEIVISSGEKAIEHLKKQLPEGKEDDISFGVDETLASDDHGSYYTIQLVSISTRVSGKTGNLGYYKVYQDGTYMPF